MDEASVNEAVDLRALSALQRLRTLSVVNGRALEVEHAWMFTELEELSAQEVGKVDLSGAARLGHLRRLHVGPALESLEPLSRLTSLEYVNLPGRWATLEPLRSLEKIESLQVRVERSAELSPLGALPRLRELVIDGARVDRLVAALSGQQQFTRLFMAGDKAVKDVEPLAKLSGLELVDLTDTSVTDISPLADLPRLADLKIWNAPVADLGVLSRFAALKSVVLSPSVTDAQRAELRRAIPGLLIY